MSISFDIIVTNGLYPLIYWRINQEQNPSAASWKNMSETPVSLKSYPRSSFGRVRLLSISPQGAVVRYQTKVHNCKCSYLLLYFIVLLKSSRLFPLSYLFQKNQYKCDIVPSLPTGLRGVEPVEHAPV